MNDFRSSLRLLLLNKFIGVKKLKQDAGRGGRIAGNARKELEKELGRSIVTKKNFLPKFHPLASSIRHFFTSSRNCEWMMNGFGHLCAPPPLCGDSCGVASH